jgi:Leucine-rich repeat (LRR) protein
VCLQDVPRLETLTMDGELDHVVLANLLSLGKSPLFLEDAFGDADEFCVRAREVELRNLPSLGTLILDGPHLRSLHLDGTPRLKSFSLARLPIPEVLIDCDEVQYPVDGETMQQIGRLSGLEVLRLTGAQVAESHWAALGGLTELRTLELSGTTITDTGWSRLPRLSHLQSLFIAGTRITTLQLAGLNELESVACRNTPLNCVNLKDLPSLRAIGGLDQAPVRDVQLARLPEFVVLSLGDTHPQRIELQGLTGLAAADLRYTRADNRCIEQLGESKQLRYLNLSGTDVTDNGLRLVARFEGLTSLDLEDNCLTDAGLAHLARLKNLQRLNLTGTLVTDEGLRHLSGMQRLELLYLGRTAVRGPGLKHLAGLPLLYKLSLGETGVTSDGLADLAKLRRQVWIRLSHTAIDDRALSHVVRLPLLTTLHLNGCAITPQGLPWLARLPALAELNVADTDLPPAEVRAAFPPRRRIHVISGEE